MCWSVVLSGVSTVCIFFFFFKQKTAYEMRISDWSSDVCSSDLHVEPVVQILAKTALGYRQFQIHVNGGQHPHVQRDRLAGTHPHQHEIGRASCRERVCQYV